MVAFENYLVGNDYLSCKTLGFKLSSIPLNTGELENQCRRSNRPGNSQAQGPRSIKTLESDAAHPPKG